ncbi:hypothetical protein TNIN_70251 [Trichonephila inaurata madagascariensis]|uniref:Uncharacterized protein n=1 Tax=Trichonephila inaurata madagascariensis TaxID=2747483 RepID=A0A8X6MLF2_9ARAC|nr:hypothetical protein TNIN_70251 [Trichonephila inaurata madagascariensis]
MIFKCPTNHNDDNQFARYIAGGFSQEKETVAVYKCFKTESQGEMNMKHPPQAEGQNIITHPLHIQHGCQKLGKRHG